MVATHAPGLNSLMASSAIMKIWKKYMAHMYCPKACIHACVSGDQEGIHANTRVMAGSADNT